MLNTIKVMLIIAVAIGMVQVAFLVTEILEPVKTDNWAPSATSELDSLRRILVYWFAGAGSTVAAFFMWRRERILSVAIGSGGIYLMLLGANNGLWSNEMLLFRVTLAALNVAFFLVILRRISAQPLNISVGTN